MNTPLPQTATSLPESDEIDIKAWFVRVARLWPWFLGFISISLLSAWFYLINTEPVYQSVATVMIKDDKKTGASTMDNNVLMALNITGSGKLLENEIEVLKSLDLIREVVLREQLYVTVREVRNFADKVLYGDDQPFVLQIANPEVIPAISLVWEIQPEQRGWTILSQTTGKSVRMSNGGGGVLDGVRFRMMETDKGKGTTVSERVFNASLVSPVLAANAYKRKLEVKQVGKQSTVITITVDDYTYTRCYAFLRSLISIYREQGLKDKNQTTSNTIRFVDERLGVVEKELQGVEFAVEQFKQSNRLTDVSEQAKLYMDMVKSIDIRKAEQETQVNIINALEKDLVAGATNPRIVPSTLGVTDLSAARLIDQYNQLILERERVASTSGIRNPALTEYDNQIRELRLNLLENIRNLKAAYQIALNDVKTQDRKLNERLVNVPALERRLLEISRDRNVKQQIYLFLLQKREESAIALASSVTDSRTIEQPRPSKKVKPNSALIYGYGFMAGLLLALIPILLIDVFDNKVGSPNEIARKCRAPLIGELNHVKQLTNPIQVGDRKRSVIAEQIRAIRTNISFTGKGSEIKTILITSHIPGEGKSFCSLNIAASYALLDKKVAVLEFDLRRPRLLKNLGLTSVKGISNYLIGQSAFEEIPIEIDGYQGNLHVLPSGPIPPNPAELILSQRMKDLHEALLSRYDYILLDSPPFSLVTDAMLLRQYADLTIVVLRQGYSHKDAYGAINERFLPETDNSPAYVILNGVNRHTRYSYYNAKYAYGAYGYGYGYGYSYGYVKQSNGYYSDDKA